MEQMEHNHEHFIRAIKGGLVVKVLNVDSHKKPAFRFKQIKAIYDSQDAGNLEHEGKFTGLPFRGVRVKTEMPFQPMSGITIKSELETCELNEDGSIYGMITLKELKQRCKPKKRKIAKSVDSSKQEMETTGSPLGSISIKTDDDDDVQSKEDICDLDEPLSSLKLKVSKKSKAKRRRIAKSKPSSAVSLKALTSVKIKIEIPESDSSDFQNVAHVADGSTFDSRTEMSSCGECSDETLTGVNGGELKTLESTSITKETPSCVVSEVSLRCLDLEEASLPMSTTELFGEVTKVGFLGMTNDVELDVTNDVGSEICVSHETFSFQHEQISCPMDSNAVAQMPDTEVSDSLRYTELNYGGDGCVFDIDGEGDNKEDDTPLDLRHNVMDYNTVTQMPDMEINDSLQSMDLNYGDDGCLSGIDVEGDSKEDTPQPNVTSDSNCLRHNVIDDDIVTKIPDTELNDSLQSMEPKYGDDGCLSGIDGEGDSKEDTPHPDVMIDSNSLGISSQTSFQCFNPHNVLDEALKCLLENHSSDATDSLKAFEEPKIHRSLKLEHRPKRFFSTRKAISPTSQEKLRQVLDSEELHDNREHSKCRERLNFETQTKEKDSLLRADLEVPEVSISPQHKIKKRKNANNGSPQLVPKGILKVPQVSCATQRAATECISVHTCAQKAIAFSQRQMHDIESLAMKLMEELKSMKGIVEETLCSEICSSTSSKYTADEIRMAIENVEGTEETTRKWLSMMAKDCHRFCKIMRSTERKVAAASVHGVQKENKKIIFADEAGGMLCHVKVFEEPHVSHLVSESQEVDI